MRLVWCVLVLCVLSWTFVYPSGNQAIADNWQAKLHDVALPLRMVVVDKALQQLHVYERHSPVRLVRTYPCTTGQQSGDKYVAGDMRTPEGVYFVGYKIAGGLDFKEYGGIAYTMNYPNPVDRLRGKTGGGIWIHSKGHEITPLETRGCVAVNLPHIAELDPLLTAGTPVIMAEHASGGLTSQQSPVTARLLKNKMQQWTKAWASRSALMFSFYDPEAYTKAQPASFQAFKANKEQLFKILPWIEIHNRDVHVLEGPDYWVTWAEQYYNAPNLSVEGVRRLYWQRDGKGEFRIVGMEWLPQNLGIRADLHKGTLAKTSGVLSDAAMPPDADEALPVGVSEAAQTKPDDGTAPERQTLAASQPMQAAKAPPATALQVQPKASEPPATASLTSPRAAGPSDKEIALLLQNRMNEWLQALKNRSPEIFAFYDPNLYGRQIGDKQSFRAFKAEHERLFRNISWLHVYFRPVTAEKQGELWVTSSALFTRDTYGSEEGIRRLYWQKSSDGRFRIVGSNWTPQSDPAIQSDYLENITPQVRAMIEAWRQAWEKGRLDGYAEFYLPQARQGARAGSGIFRHKTLVWAKAGPEKVELSGMRIQLEKGGLRVDMEQVYRDTAGYQDKGVKTLILVPQNDTWRIAAEDWAPQPGPQS